MKWYLFGLALILAVSGTALTILVSTTTPDTAPLAVRLLFFVVLTLLLWSVLTFLRLAIFRYLQKKTLHDSLLVASITQSVIMTSVLVIALLVQKFLL